MRYGILLVGGSATRLQPATAVVSKQLLPVYDKPMFYYPLTTLIESGLPVIFVIATPQDEMIYRTWFAKLRLGVEVRVLVQHEPKGIADALRLVGAALGAKRTSRDKFVLALGDNLFHGSAAQTIRDKSLALDSSASLFLCQVANPGDYGVYDETQQQIVEKPSEPPSSWAVTGLYVYPAEAIAIANSLLPSARGELEITDVNNVFLQNGRAQLFYGESSELWFDMGTPDSLLAAAQYVQSVQARTGRLLGCPELAAAAAGCADAETLQTWGISRINSRYYSQLRAKLAASHSLC